MDPKNFIGRASEQTVDFFEQFVDAIPCTNLEADKDVMI